jgi:hypothetical protein
MTILQSFKRGSWTAHVVQLSHQIDSRVQLDHPNGFNTSWPIRYDNGQIGYDYDGMSRDAQRATRAAFNWRDRQPLSATEGLPVADANRSVRYV